MRWDLYSAGPELEKHSQLSLTGFPVPHKYNGGRTEGFVGHVRLEEDKKEGVIRLSRASETRQVT